jgi:RNA polymerase sigma-70 factor (ECF subfamily)
MTASITWTLSAGAGAFAVPDAPAPGRTLALSPPRPMALPEPDRSPGADVSLEDLDERTLIDACRTERPGAFDLLVERHRRSVYQLCYRFVGNHEDASDLSQDVFLRAYRGLRGFRGQSSVATWLYRIGVNVCLNRVSARATLGKLTEPIADRQFEDSGAESASDRVLRDERAARVRAAIARLPRTQRATLILRTYQEMTHQEIATVLGSTVGAVKANFFHALANLKKQLGENT